MLENQKNKLFLLIFGVIAIGAVIVHASSFSTSYSVNSESLDYAHNGGFLESTSYAMDLSGIPWTDGQGESTSYTILDSNSNLEVNTTPSAPTGTTGGSAGGRSDNYVNQPIGDIDDPDLVYLEEEEFDELDLNEVLEEQEEIKETAADDTTEEIVEEGPQGTITAIKEGISESQEKPLEGDSDLTYIEKIPLKPSPMIESELGGITTCCWIALILSIAIILHVLYKFIELWVNRKKRK